MYKKVLLPIDGLPNLERSQKALDRALQVCDGELVLLHVTDPIAGIVGGEAREELVKESKAKGLLALGPFLEILQQKCVPFHTRLEAGITEETIVRIADEEDVELIVMFTDGREGLGDMLLGSITERVLRDTNRDLLAVRK